MSGTLLAATSPDMVIGRDGGIPWHYPGDLRRFKRLTLGHTVVMGRRTWESLPGRPLPGRRNLVLTLRSLDGVECFRTLAEAVPTVEGELFFIGGAQLYREALGVADFIDLTLVPDDVPVEGSVLFPPIPPEWEPGPVEQHPDEPTLRLQRWTRR